MIVNIKPPDTIVQKINKPRRKLDSFDKCALIALAMVIIAALIEVLR